MDKKICIITGANAGIGKQAAIKLAEKNCHVILACRNQQRGEEAMESLKKLNPAFSTELQLVDMGNLDSIRKFAANIKMQYKSVDVIIHNAAVFNITQKKRLETMDGIETVWATNHIGPVLLTELLLDQLKNSGRGRIITIASKGLLAKPLLKIDLEDPEFKKKKYSIVNAYYQSKRAQIMYTYWLAKRLKPYQIMVNCIRVTAVKIDISRHPELSRFMKWVYKQKAAKSLSPEEMAETYVWAALDPKLNHVTGKYFDENNHEVDSNKYSRNYSDIYAMMKLTQDYIPELSGAL